MTTIQGFVTKHPASTYFTVTFAISWGGALLAIGGLGGMQGTTPASDPRFPSALIAMLAGPSLSGVLLTAVVHGRAGLHDCASRLLTWRADSCLYAVAILAAPVMMTATLVALSFISPAFVPGIFTAPDKPSLLLVSLSVGVSAGLVEEIGWTGFAIPTLRERHGVLATGVIVGIWWSAWHLLPNVWASDAAAGDLPRSVYFAGLGIGLFVGYLTAFRILMVWVYDETRSLLIAMLMHVSLTTSLLILNPTGISGANLVVFSFAFAAVVWTAVVAIALGRGRRLEHRQTWNATRIA